MSQSNAQGRQLFRGIRRLILSEISEAGDFKDAQQVKPDESLAVPLRHCRHAG
jgi:hypothetical protein